MNRVSSQKTAQRHAHWKREILQIARSTQDISRMRIKEISGLSMDFTLALVSELLEEALLVECGKAESGGAGRRATRLALNPEGCFFIGVRFNASQVTAVCMNFALEVTAVRREQLSAQPDADALLSAVEACVKGLLQFLGPKRKRLLGVGLGAPGILDVERGVMVRYAHVPTLSHVPLRRRIQELCGVPVYMEHGVRCSARAVLSMPGYAKTREMIFLQMGRGVHLCVVVGGSVHEGAQQLAGEIGRMRCGGVELEELVASDALCRCARRRIESGDARFSGLTGVTEITPDVLCQAADRGCEGARDLLETAGRAVGEALSAAVMLLNPADVVLSGKWCASSFFEQAVRGELEARCLPESVAQLRFAFLLENQQQDAVGAAMLPYVRCFLNR